MPAEGYVLKGCSCVDMTQLFSELLICKNFVRDNIITLRRPTENPTPRQL